MGRRWNKSVDSRPGFNIISPNFNLAKPKRSVSRHLEMMIAFLLFFAFVTFLLVYIKPFQKSEKIISDSVIESVRKGFENEFGAEVRKIFLKVDEFFQGCVSVDVGEHLNENKNVHIIENSNYKLDGDNLILDLSASGQNFDVYFSEKFNSLTTSFECISTSMDGVVIGSIEDINVLFLDNAIDYNSLKTNSGIPDTINFKIKEVDGDFTLGADVPENTDIFAKSYFFEVWNEGIKTKEFLFKVW